MSSYHIIYTATSKKYIDRNELEKVLMFYNKLVCIDKYRKSANKNNTPIELYNVCYSYITKQYTFTNCTNNTITDVINENCKIPKKYYNCYYHNIITEHAFTDSDRKSGNFVSNDDLKLILENILTRIMLCFNALKNADISKLISTLFRYLIENDNNNIAINEAFTEFKKQLTNNQNVV